MKAAIEAKLNPILQDFNASLDGAQGLCTLKDLTYKGRHIPDYSNQMIQQCYLLRYYAAYLFEYKYMYGLMMHHKLADQPLRILSIGTGCGVDFDGLQLAIRAFPAYQDDVQYTGVDLVNWGYRTPLPGGSRFLTQDITAWDTFDRPNYNVLMFPKSIAEFPAQVFAQLLGLVRGSRFECDRICLACSLMVEGRRYDTDRFSQLVSVMTEQHDYKPVGDPAKFFAFNEKKGIRGVENSWVFPDNVADLLQNLLPRCRTYASNGRACNNGEIACNLINRRPIMRTDHFAFKVLGLVRD